MNKDEIKKALRCCASLSTYCIDCPYYNNGDFSCDDGKMHLDALNLITEQEKEIEQITEERNLKKAVAKEILQCLYDKCYEIQNSRECVAHITPLDILILAKEYGVEVEE